MQSKPADLTGDDLTHSLSGRERDHTFLACDSRAYEETSALTGLDDIGDGRVFATFDYDHDGWIDVATVSHTSPFFQLFRNRMSQLQTGRFTAIRLVGGNRTSLADAQWSNRDAIGSRLTYNLGSRRFIRDLKGQEGLATMPSRTLLIGLGNHSQLEGLSIRWPSGKTTEIGALESGHLTTIYENPAQSDSGKAIVTSLYREAALAPRESVGLTWSNPQFSRPSSKLKLTFLFATWCASCKSETPRLKELVEQFTEDEISLFCFGIDPLESQQELNNYWEKQELPYTLLDVTSQDRAFVNQLMNDSLGQVGPSMTILTDQNDQVLSVHHGIPTVSEVRKKLYKPIPEQRIEKLATPCEKWKSERTWIDYLGSSRN